MIIVIIYQISSILSIHISCQFRVQLQIALVDFCDKKISIHIIRMYVQYMLNCICM